MKIDLPFVHVVCTPGLYEEDELELADPGKAAEAAPAAPAAPEAALLLGIAVTLVYHRSTGIQAGVAVHRLTLAHLRVTVES